MSPPLPSAGWLAVRREPSPPRRRLLLAASFLLPLGVWMLVSYLPWLWHPMVRVADPGGVTFFQAGDRVQRAVFLQAVADQRAAGAVAPTGERANPIYLPAPHEVAAACVRAFTTPPRRPDQPWFHESILHSLSVVMTGFLLASLVGVPLGVLCGTYPSLRWLHEPFIEFFRYLPAPAFGALAVAVLGIQDAPKVAIIFIGTFFQQVLVLANTTRQVDLALLDAAQTLGASRRRLLTQVVLPGALPGLYRDQRILLGWAWTYLVIAEVVGESTGITWFINQQGKYRQYDNVFAAILVLGLIGLLSDLLLQRLGRALFPWHREDRP
jgi:NitT/TauT family transport system permease protein